MGQTRSSSPVHPDPPFGQLADLGSPHARGLPRPARLDLRRPCRDLPARRGRSRACHRVPDDRRRRDRRAGDQRGRRDRPGSRTGRGLGVQPALPAAAGRPRPPDDRGRAPDGERARADGRPLRPRREGGPAAGPGHRGARRDQADGPADGDGRGGHGRAGLRGDHRPRRRGCHRPRQGRRGDGQPTSPELRRAALRRLDPRRRGGRRRRAARPLLRADRRPRGVDRQPGGVRGHRSQPGRRWLPSSSPARCPSGPGWRRPRQRPRPPPGRGTARPWWPGPACPRRARRPAACRSGC